MKVLGWIIGLAAGFGLGSMVTQSIALGGVAGIVLGIIVGQIFGAFGREAVEKEVGFVSGKDRSTWKAIVGWLIFFIIGAAALAGLGLLFA